ncbi:MAG: hypothetical protein QG565_45 [Campylobacterota bacterium]|nr:hypothetical protein [Campylobacterota bacterium]MDQ1337302.1 hypothetical protein [Campylobacterota bacterium]
MDFAYENHFLTSLAITTSIELSVITLLLYFFGNIKMYKKQDILIAGTLPSIVTLPYLWFVLPVFFIGQHFLYVIVGEISVTLAEVFIIYKILNISFKKAFLFSVLANLCSYSFGYFIRQL